MRTSIIIRKKSGLTLIEVLVALAIFSAAMAAASGVFLSIQDAWRRQRTAIELLQNGRWAMEFMTNELRSTMNDGNPGYNKLKDKAGGKQLIFAIDTDGDGTVDIQIQYLVSGTQILRSWKTDGPGGTFSSPAELVNHLVVPNPSGDKIFNGDKDGYIVIELTLRPDPSQPEGVGNRNVVFRSSVICRND